MKTEIPLLENVRIASPCPKRWDDMVGGDRVRYCRECSKNVYNLSEMRQEEAENLLQTHEGKLCLTFYRRADGKILTADCPVGLRGVRRAYLNTAVKVNALCLAIFGVTFAILFPALGRTTGERVHPENVVRLIEHDKKEIAEIQGKLNDKKHPFSAKIRAEMKEKLAQAKEHLSNERKRLIRIVSARNRE